MSKYDITCLEQMDYLIRIKGTGHPQQLAERLGISRRSVYNYIEFLKERGAPVAYSRSRTSFYYKEDGYFSFRFLSKM